MSQSARISPYAGLTCPSNARPWPPRPMKPSRTGPPRTGAFDAAAAPSAASAGVPARARKKFRRPSVRWSGVIFFPLAAGPHPRRVLPLRPRLGFARLRSASARHGRGRVFSHFHFSAFVAPEDLRAIAAIIGRHEREHVGVIAAVAFSELRSADQEGGRQRVGS